MHDDVDRDVLQEMREECACKFRHRDQLIC